MIDLSIGIEREVASEPWPPTIDRFDHTDGANKLADRLRELGVEGITAEDFSEGIGLAWEELRAITHMGTHMDAPWHYGPTAEGTPDRTIDEVPLQWACGQAVVLDFTDIRPGAEIEPVDIDNRLNDLDHDLTDGEIVLLETGADALWGTADYLRKFPRMGADTTKHLVDSGIRVIGTDTYGFDKPFAEMGARYAESGDAHQLWPAHFAGREVEYCQIEKMANLDALSRRTEIPLVTCRSIFRVPARGGYGRWRSSKHWGATFFLSLRGYRRYAIAR